MARYVFSIFLCFIPLCVFSADYIAGQDYEVIQFTGQSNYKGGPINVTEFFSYGCPWCYRLDAAIGKWVLGKGDAIKFSRVPVVFHAGWDNYARAYYLIDSLSLGKNVHDNLFKAIIEDKKSLASNQEMVIFFQKNGVDAVLAESAFANSPSIELRMKADAALMAKYQINAVPTIVVNQQYKTNLQMAKSEDRLFEITNYLLDKVKH